MPLFNTRWGWVRGGGTTSVLITPPTTPANQAAAATPSTRAATLPTTPPPTPTSTTRRRKREEEPRESLEETPKAKRVKTTNYQDVALIDEGQYSSYVIANQLRRTESDNGFVAPISSITIQTEDVDMEVAVDDETSTTLRLTNTFPSRMREYIMMWKEHEDPELDYEELVEGTMELGTKEDNDMPQVAGAETTGEGAEVCECGAVRPAPHNKEMCHRSEYPFHNDPADYWY